jgi:hypothetical protein
MNIVKKLSGNVHLEDASGKILKVLINVNSLDVVSNNEIIVKYGFNQWVSIFADKVQNTEVEPAAAIPFSGDAYALVAVLSGSFFFSLNGTGIIAYPVVNYSPQGGTIGGTQPTFSGDPLITGKYMKINRLVHFEIQVDFDNILTFGTGQYFLTLPFEVCCNYQLRDGCVHDDSAGRQYSIGGHADLNSDVIELNYIGTNGRDEAFEHNQPFVLDVADNFHIAGTYLTN